MFNMRRATLLNQLEQMILGRVRGVARGEAAALFASWRETWALVMEHEKQVAFAEGVKSMTPHDSADRQGYRDGWSAGYEAGLERVLGRTGVPATERCETDDCGKTPPVS
jgi:hypothetical protein